MERMVGKLRTRISIVSYDAVKQYWNDELAEIALRYARACVFDHDTAHQRSVPSTIWMIQKNFC